MDGTFREKLESEKTLVVFSGNIITNEFDRFMCTRGTYAEKLKVQGGTDRMCDDSLSFLLVYE